jgi:hypothetical protein
MLSLGLNEIVNPERSPNRKKRHDVSSYEQEIRNKLSGISPVRSISMTPTFPSNSPSGSHSSEYSSSSMNQSRPPLSAITPTKTNLSTGYSEKTKPRPLTKRMGFKRAVMQKLKITKTNR